MYGLLRIKQIHAFLALRTLRKTRSRVANIRACRRGALKPSAQMLFCLFSLKRFAACLSPRVLLEVPRAPEIGQPWLRLASLAAQGRAAGRVCTFRDVPCFTPGVAFLTSLHESQAGVAPVQGQAGQAAYV